jgi:hypothetical protein
MLRLNKRGGTMDSSILQSIIDDLDSHIRTLQDAKEILVAKMTTHPAPPELDTILKPNRPLMSAETRKKISEKTKKRWRERKAKEAKSNR